MPSRSPDTANAPRANIDGRAILERAAARRSQDAVSWRASAWSTDSGFVMAFVTPPGFSDSLPAPYWFVDRMSVVEHAAEQRSARVADTLFLFVPQSMFADGVPDVQRGVMRRHTPRLLQQSRHMHQVPRMNVVLRCVELVVGSA